MLRTLSAGALVLALAACGTPSGPRADRIVYRTSEGPPPALEPADPLEDAAPPAPEDDLPESKRIEFHERWGGQETWVPPFDRPPRPAPEPRQVRRAPSHLWFTVPLSLALGWTVYHAVRHHDRHWHGHVRGHW